MVSCEYSFNEAVADERNRQPYLDTLLACGHESISKAIYDPTGINAYRHIDDLVSWGYHHTLQALKLRSQIAGSFANLCMLQISAAGMYGCGFKQPVFVLPASFKYLPTEAHFLSVLFDHEGAHASCLMKGISLSGGRVIDFKTAHCFDAASIHYIEEYLAFKSQLEKMDSRGLRDDVFRIKIHTKLEVYRMLANMFFNID